MFYNFGVKGANLKQSQTSVTGPSGGISKTEAKHKYQTFIYDSPLYHVYFRNTVLDYIRPSNELVWCFFENPINPDTNNINLQNPLPVLKKKEPGRDTVVIRYTDSKGKTDRRTIRFTGDTNITVNDTVIKVPKFYIEIYNPESKKADTKLFGIIMTNSDYNSLVSRSTPQPESQLGLQAQIDDILAMEISQVVSPVRSPTKEEIDEILNWNPSQFGKKRNFVFDSVKKDIRYLSR